MPLLVEPLLVVDFARELEVPALCVGVDRELVLRLAVPRAELDPRALNDEPALLPAVRVPVVRVPALCAVVERDFSAEFFERELVPAERDAVERVDALRALVELEELRLRGDVSSSSHKPLNKLLRVDS